MIHRPEKISERGQNRKQHHDTALAALLASRSPSCPNPFTLRAVVPYLGINIPSSQADASRADPVSKARSIFSHPFHLPEHPTVYPRRNLALLTSPCIYWGKHCTSESKVTEVSESSNARGAQALIPDDVWTALYERLPPLSRILIYYL
jgi:hypothetical protein